MVDFVQPTYNPHTCCVLIHINKNKYKLCNQPRTGLTDLIPYCQKHYSEIWHD